MSADAAAGLGAVYLIGRIIYFMAYVRNPKNRSLGYGLSAGPVAVLVIGALIGAAIAFYHHG